MAQVDAPDTRLVPVIAEPAAIDATPQEPDSNTVLMLVDEMPEFPGGMAALFTYVKENLRYPKAAQEMNVVGKVLVNFVVEKDGRVVNARVVRGIGHGCDEEALRVVQEMPRWKPGQQSGKNVRVQFTLPISFKLVERE